MENRLCRRSGFLIKSMAKIQSQSTSNPTSISQYAALEALTSSNNFLSENNAVFIEEKLNIRFDK